MKIIGIIPCRYQSTRFPGKALALLGGKPVLQHVIESASKYPHWDNLVVATDDDRISDFCKSYGIESIMTSRDHKDCLDRSWDAVEKMKDVDNPIKRYVIIQGDEPFFDHNMLNCDLTPEIVNFYTKVSRPEEISDPNVVKVVVSKNLKAIYFSRYSIPYFNQTTVKSNDSLVIDKQIGVYSFSGKMLQKFKNLGMSYLEGIEGIGLLRFIENDIDIQMRYTDHDSISIDTPDDLFRAEIFIANAVRPGEF